MCGRHRPTKLDGEELTPKEPTGTITTSEGETDEEYDLKAALAKDIEGYYPLVVPSAEGKLEGTSWSGAELRGTRSGLHISAKLAPPGGGRFEALSFRAPTIGAGENRWIVLQKEGQLRIKGAQSSGRQALAS
jgi:hypothetical protein